MSNSLKGKIAFSGFTVLAIGVGLLLFTFYSAYGFLTAGMVKDVVILGIEDFWGSDLIQELGDPVSYPAEASAVPGAAS